MFGAATRLNGFEQRHLAPSDPVPQSGESDLKWNDMQESNRSLQLAASSTAAPDHKQPESRSPSLQPPHHLSGQHLLVNTFAAGWPGA